MSLSVEFPNFHSEGVFLSILWGSWAPGPGMSSSRISTKEATWKYYYTSLGGWKAFGAVHGISCMVHNFMLQ